MELKAIRVSAFFSLFFLISCIGKQEKMIQFVKDYNKASNGFVQNYVKSTEADKMSDNEIRITFSLSIVPDNNTKEMYKHIFPEIIKEMLNSLPLSKGLLNEGVDFSFQLLDDKRDLVLSQIYNKEYFTLNKNTESGLFEDSQLSLPKFVAMINKGLPIVDTVENITILKLELLNDQEIQYVYQIPDDLLKDFKEQPDMKELYKSYYLNDKKQLKTLKDVFQLGIKKFYFTFINKDNTQSERIEFTPSDLTM